MGGRRILDSVSFEAGPGTMMGVLGPNGAGKSTLFDVLAGLRTAEEGEVRIHGDPLRRGHSHLAYVPQHEKINWRIPVTVRDTALQGRIRSRRWYRPTPAEDFEAVENALVQVGLEDRQKDLVRDLSVGQRQRVFLARALVQGADILLLDETLSGVDVPSTESLMRVLWELRDQGTTILFSSHVIEQVSHYCDQCLCINRRVCACGRTDSVLSPATLHELYGPYGAVSAHREDCE